MYKAIIAQSLWGINVFLNCYTSQTYGGKFTIMFSSFRYIVGGLIMTYILRDEIDWEQLKDRKKRYLIIRGIVVSAVVGTMLFRILNAYALIHIDGTLASLLEQSKLIMTALLSMGFVSKMETNRKKLVFRLIPPLIFLIAGNIIFYNNKEWSLLIGITLGILAQFCLAALNVYNNKMFIEKKVSLVQVKGISSVLGGLLLWLSVYKETGDVVMETLNNQKLFLILLTALAIYITSSTLYLKAMEENGAVMVETCAIFMLLVTAVLDLVAGKTVNIITTISLIYIVVIFIMYYRETVQKKQALDIL